MANFTDGITAYTVDRSLRRSTKPRTVKFDFGDGYTQRIQQGINSLKEVYTVAFNNRTSSEIDGIVAFLELKEGVDTFSFSPPNLGTLTGTTSFSGNSITVSSGFNTTVLSPATPDRVLITNSNNNDGGYIINQSSTATNSDTTITVVETLTTEASTPSVTVSAAIAVVCEDWSQVYKYESIYSLTAQFTRVYES